MQGWMPAHVLKAKHHAVFGAEPGLMRWITHTSLCRAEIFKHTSAANGFDDSEREESGVMTLDISAWVLRQRSP